MLVEELYSSVLLDPVRRGADQLDVVSGYATPAMASTHVADLLALRGDKDFRVNLVVGMVQHEGLRLDFHRGFVDLERRCSEFACHYVTKPLTIHSKVYLWYRNGEPFEAYVGSANYTRTGMGTGRVGRNRREAMVQTDPHLVKPFVDGVWASTIRSTHEDVHEFVQLVTELRKPAESELARADEVDHVPLGASPVQPDAATLPIVQQRSRRVHGPGGGLNHGMRGNRKNKNEAYLPIPANISRSGFFPPRGQHFLVSTDDDKVLLLSTGSGRPEQPKDLRTPLNNGLLGEYFRNRLGVANGALIEQRHIDAYGRDDVEFTKLDEETYFMNFEQP